MKKTKFKLSNHFEEAIQLSLEPEGMIHDLPVNDSVDITVSATENPSIDIQVRKDENGVYLSIWPLEGDFEIE